MTLVLRSILSSNHQRHHSQILLKEVYEMTLIFIRFREPIRPILLPLFSLNTLTGTSKCFYVSNNELLLIGFSVECFISQYEVILLHQVLMCHFLMNLKSFPNQFLKLNASILIGIAVEAIENS